MKLPISLLLLSVSLVAGPALRAADDVPEEPKTNMKDVLRARIAEDAKKQPAPAAPKPATKSDKAEASEPAAPSATPSSAPVGTPGTTATAKDSKPTAQQPPTVLPKVEVKKGRITVLDQQLALQDEAIAREKKNLKSTEVDTALNDSKVAKPLAIFGGESSQFRQKVASERVQLMEAEKDLMEAIAHAKTKKEKEELQKQLDELKAMRRELDKSLR
jgi:hypothetical protein